MEKSKLSARKLAIGGMLGAVSVVLGLTPLGFIPVGPTRATIMHVPVIIGAIIEGPIVGVLVGLIFGLFSIYQAVMMPTVVSFAFLNPLVAIVPRLLIGVFTYFAYKFVRSLGNKKTSIILNIIWGLIIVYLGYGIYTIINNKPDDLQGIIINIVLLILTGLMTYLTNKKKEAPLDVAIAAIVGTLTNTIFVLGTIFLLYAERFVTAIGGDVSTAGKVIAGIGLVNGIPETIVAVLVATSVVTAIRKRERTDE
ncbi:MAG: ECF transporter S component [Tissierellia bacterium]|nr:ECF transporter S component [Tissierellia bacterium]